MADIYVAKCAFVTTLNGRVVHVREGATVREGHPLLDHVRGNFVPQRIDFEVDKPKRAPKSTPVVEEATAEPGERRKVTPRGEESGRDV